MHLKSLKINGGGVIPTYALKATSPAIDVGNDTGCPPFDANVKGRVDVPNVGTSVCDSGAFEFQLP